MVDFINNIGIDAQGGVGQIPLDNALQEEGLVQESVEMEYSYTGATTTKNNDYQLVKLSINGQQYTGIPDIFQSNDPAIKTMFDALRSDSVITDDMTLEDQKMIMSYLVSLSNTVQENSGTNKATAFNGTENVSVTSFIEPQDEAVSSLASQLQAQGIITSSMSDAEKLAAITSYVNANVSYETDAVGEGWSTAANTIASGSGDCEDMAVLVASLAIACGVDESNVQVCVKAGSADNQGHVVVGLFNSNGQISTFDAITNEKSSATSSDFTFTFSTTTVTSGDGSVGNGWAMEDASNANSLYTAASVVSQVRNTIANAIDGTYSSMLDYANKLDQYTDPGKLFILQQELQTMKDMIATYTAVGKMIGDTLSEAMQSFASALNNS